MQVITRPAMTKLRLADIDLELFDSDQRGDRPHPILFLHGGSGFHPQQPFVAPLSERRRLVVPSHPGFGQSSLPDWLDSVDDIAHLYLELMDLLKFEHIDLVGCFIGGWIAAEMATKAPARFRRLVLVGPVGIKVGPSDRLDIPDIFAMPQAEVEKLLYHDPARMQLDPPKMSEDDLAAMFRARETLALLTWEPWMHNPKLTHRLHRIKAPALFIRGESDGLVSQSYLEAYARLVPNARISTIKSAGHAPQLEQPAVFAAEALKFFGE